MHFALGDLVSLKDFQEVMQSLYRATGVANRLLDAEGMILYESGWQDLCERFYASCPLGAVYCEQSEQDIAAAIAAGRTVEQDCRNGLGVFARPVLLEGQRLGTLVLGQFFYVTPDLAFFRAQARQLGLEEGAYLAAIQKLPVIAREVVESIVDCHVRLVQLLAARGLELQRTRQQSRQELAAVRSRQNSLKTLLEQSPVAIACSRLDGRMQYVNRKFTEMFGYRLEELPTLDTWHRLAYPDPEQRRQVFAPWLRQGDEARLKGTRPPDIELSVLCRDGTVRQVMESVSWVDEQRLVSFTDITARWQAEQHEHNREHTLELIAAGRPLHEILEDIVRAIEQERPEVFGSILLLDRDGRHLRLGAAPRLPADYNQAVDGVAIGNNVGSCGTAAFLRERVIVSDIATDPRWASYRGMARMAGLAACWSEPFFASDGRLLGTFAIYHAVPCSPDEADLVRIRQAANLATIAVEHDQARRELESRAYMDYLTGLANRRYFMEFAEKELLRTRKAHSPVSLLMVDIDFFKHINDQYGHKSGDLVLQALARVFQNSLREVDLVGRIGGEEFAILLPETDLHQAMRVSERLRLAVESARVMTPEEPQQIRITVSVGVVSLLASDSLASLDNLLGLADRALYQAKQTGRNRVCSVS